MGKEVVFVNPGQGKQHLLVEKEKFDGIFFFQY